MHEFTEGPSKCNLSDPQTIYLTTWNFNNDESVLEIASGTSKIALKILSLTSFELEVEATNDNTRQVIKYVH
ncbi:MAG: hypothetical protein H7Y27_04780 [Gemmatimonadaceae bacterium]|nr:hypothetical protein [Chitinophagaceae bacterium]